ncbi:MAG: hypothetical protein JSU72_13620 [Deltaproteobacteria bacterium]|nr:MAG: hypothetical protein JSU72_13620 [Deltaproteobacteria bacterium]
MRLRKPFSRVLFLWNLYLIMAALTFVCLTSVIGNAEARYFPKRTLNGVVESNGEPLAGYKVDLYVSYVGDHPSWRKLGADRTDDNGQFVIRFRSPNRLPHGHESVLFVLAEDRPVMLANAIGKALSGDGGIVVNERTTVATGVAFAQFVKGRKILGNRYGMINAVRMAANMANPETGEVGEVLSMTPNGTETSTLPTFNSLGNIVASCVADSANCNTLFEKATPPGGSAPSTVLQALANMTKYPSNNTSNNISDLFQLADDNPVYTPALAEAPTSWLLFIKFTGGFYSDYDYTNLMSGPGNVAFDERGFAWINDNYLPTPELEVPSCAGLRLMKFYPWGESFPGSPYFGGGLSGAGFGITLDPQGDIWVGNFGFEAPACTELDDPEHKVPATHNSVSLFRPDGSPISGFDGFTKGKMWWPQGTVSDKKGNIWVANCGNDTVTLIPRGKPWRARNIPLPGGQGEAGNFTPSNPEIGDSPFLKPFAIAIDPKGLAWVKGNRADWDGQKGHPAGLVYRISPDGTVDTLPNPNGDDMEPILKWPMGIAGDSKGNMWVSNSDAVNVPCVTPLASQDGDGPSIVLYPSDGSSPSVYTGGGLTIPWGNAVDGNDTLWVFNFGRKPTDDVGESTTWNDTGVSHFCGADERKCPAGLKRGDAISPATGYVSDALDRVTGGGIDPSGNLWLMNNWKKTGPYGPVYDTNPGGNSFVIVPGAAKPIKTPLIGPPESFDKPWHLKGHGREDRDDRED